MQSAAEAERLQAAFVAAGGSGEPPTDQLMYEPGLGQIYVADDRFRKNIDQHGEGLAAYMAAGIDASG